MKAHALWVGASALALGLGWSGSAMAQDTPAEQNGSEAKGDEEIVVTAQRRHENLMTTPVSASVLSGGQLENKGVTNVDALQFAMPSVVVNNFGQGNDFNVRGIGKAEHNTQTTTGVITYRDGVPTFPGYVQGEPYYDINNIQVLRGPQGTIVGQNATGGAVFINTNDPIIGGGTHGYVQVQGGNFADVGGQFGVNLPVSDRFAMRVSGYGERRDGFYKVTGPGGVPYKDNNNDLRMLAGRISFLWKPVDGLTILSKTDAAYMDFGAYPASPQGQFPETLPGTTTPNPNHRDLFDITANAPGAAHDKFVRSILRIEYEFAGGVRLRSVSSYQWANTYYKTDLDGTSNSVSTFFDDVNEQQMTQEIALISPDNRQVTWLLGVSGVWNDYHFKEPYQFVVDLAPGFNLPAFQYKLQGWNTTRSLAAWGSLGIQLSPSVKLEAGGRYTSSRSINDVDVVQYGTPIIADQQTQSDNFSYKVSLGWKVNPDHFLYAFVATGFRPGGLNVPVGLGLPAPFLPEQVTSFEGGWKANFADGHVRTTVNGFYNKYHNFQVIIGYPTFPTFGIELNVPHSTKIYGFEAEAEFRFGDFSLDAGVNLLHSELGTFYASDPRAATTTPCNPLSGPSSATCLNLAGREQTYAPNFTFNVGAQYIIHAGDNDRIIPRANYGHVGAQWATLFENPARGDRIVERNILNAQVAWEHGTWTVTAYGTNLTDQHYPGALNSGLYFAGPPRQYGVKVLKVF
ncbi:TonB-dependent receptor [Sphingomonas sp. LB-2]|uniref:TonB-dependent receptor n=1 Tax=Sphingomonas caeni TaxID=2984949 RepID=UPI00222E124F|nr:TonB-dependent receptor [Sphingomonas caeni]MCW3848016.1 TonB-dependent receptor [Sphingomonas caeni]